MARMAVDTRPWTKPVALASLCLGIGLGLLTLRTLDGQFVHDSPSSWAVVRLSVAALLVGVKLLGLRGRRPGIQAGKV